MSLQSLKIFLASPGDVNRERTMVEQVVEEINRTVASSMGIVLELVRWEKNTFPDYGIDPQSIINEQIAEMRKYALFVGIMWNKIGTATKRSDSGTIEEFERAVAARRSRKLPTIMFYFRTGGSRPTGKQQVIELGKVFDFQDSIKKKNYYRSYTSPSRFKEEFREHLTLWLNEQAAATSSRPKSPLRQVVPRMESRSLVPANENNVSQELSTSKSASKTSRSVTKPPAQQRLTKQSALLLGDRLYYAKSVTIGADSIVMHVLPVDAAEKAALTTLRPAQYQQKSPVAFAHQDDGAVIIVESVDNTTENGKTVFVINAKYDESWKRANGGLNFNYNGLTADQVAKMRAELLLLKASFPSTDFGSQLPSLSWSSGVPQKREFETGILPPLWSKLKSRPVYFQIYARLYAIYALRAIHVVEHILEMTISSVKNGGVTVHFRGERKSSGSADSPTRLEVKGICKLT